MALTEGSTSVISVRVLVTLRGACISSSYGMHDAPWPYATQVSRRAGMLFRGSRTMSSGAAELEAAPPLM